MQNVVMGGNAPLSAARFDVVIEWPVTAGTLDSSTYLIGSTGQVRSDADMVFYNQPSDVAGCVSITGIGPGRTQLAVDLARVPVDIDRIVMCVTIEESNRTMAAFQGAAATIVVDGQAELSFRPDLANASEVAMRLVALYRRNGAWKFRADGQGFNEGLAPLARSFGIDVAQDEPVPPRETAPVDRPREPGPKAEIELVREAASKPIPPVLASESQLSLTPPSPRLDDVGNSLTALHAGAQWGGETGPEFGEIIVKLAWSAQCGGLHGRPRPLEPGLGCFYELQDGRCGLVQSWDGNGQFDTAPFVHLTHAESGGSRGEQKLRVNGSYWSSIRKLTLFSYLQSGALSWHTASLQLTASTAGHKPVSAALENAPSGSGIVALVTMENGGDGVRFTRLMKFAPGHQELDTELGWNLRWRTRYV